KRLAPGGKVVQGRGQHNYHQSFTILDEEGSRVALVLAGGPNGHPNVTASGNACDAFVPLVRELWPVHRPTRIDAAEDFQGEGVFEDLEGVCRAVTTERNIEGLAMVNDDPEKGRSYLMGAKSSAVGGRLYDKSAELRAHYPPERQGEILPHITRLEVAVRVPSAWREAAARWEPEHVFMASDWTQDLARRVLALELERVMQRPRRVGDYERSRRAMLAMFKRVLHRMHLEHGDWQAVGLQIGYELGELESAQRRMKGRR
ncbi:MAG: hypothetical protein IH568_02370, partial [Burkholderiaceae bacterium]|nr:hypothetical protein [Burkholderiaceae bacterium]